MIDILTNGFLTNPIPTNINLNYCSHDCAYCFANLNSPNRQADVSGILSQLRNYKKRDDLVSWYLRNKYPVNISNNIDPFSKSNYRIFQQIRDFLVSENIPIQIATRGGIGWKETSDVIDTSVWYISVPYNDDAIRNKLEPNAPSLEDRFAMAKEVIKKHNIIIALNPLNEKFCSTPMEIIKKYEDIGVTDFWINYMHLSNKQQSNLTKQKRESIGEDILKNLNKEPSDWFSDNANIISEYCEDNGHSLHGLSFGQYSTHEEIWKQTYPNLLPTEQDFFNWCAENKGEGDFIYFEEFFNFFSNKIPNIETNISKFLFNKAVLDDKSSYKKTQLTDLLHYYWEIKGVSLNWAMNLPSFSWVKKKGVTKTDFMYDVEHNKVMMYHPNNWNLKDYTII